MAVPSGMVTDKIHLVLNVKSCIVTEKGGGVARSEHLFGHSGCMMGIPSVCNWSTVV